MNPEPRDEGDYSSRQVEAARRVLVDLTAADWRARQDDALVGRGVAILKEKFSSVDHYGPRQLAAFHSGGSPDEGEMHARRAYELVQKLLSLL